MLDPERISENLEIFHNADKVIEAALSSNSKLRLSKISEVTEYEISLLNKYKVNSFYELRDLKDMIYEFDKDDFRKFKKVEQLYKDIKSAEYINDIRNLNGCENSAVSEYINALLEKKNSITNIIDDPESVG